ncbi:MAG: response regulator [Candidatus Omnitrophota bacterium]
MGVKKVFIVEDDPDSFESLKKLLLVYGFEVDGVLTIKDDFLKHLKTFEPHIILLDMLMPGIGGLEVCQMLNADEQTQGIPILVVSAIGNPSDMKKAFALGVEDYVTKPYDIATLVGKINRYIGYKQNP